jgi:hypothetical protein
MTEYTFDLKKCKDDAILDGVPMGIPMLPPEVVQFMNTPEVVALATAVQLATPVVAIALAAKRWLTSKTPRSGGQNRNAGPVVAEIVERPNEIVARYHGREVGVSHHAADKIFALLLELDPHQGAPEPPEGPDTP